MLSRSTHVVFVTLIKVTQYILQEVWVTIEPENSCRYFF